MLSAFLALTIFSCNSSEKKEESKESAQEQQKKKALTEEESYEKELEELGFEDTSEASVNIELDSLLGSWKVMGLEYYGYDLTPEEKEVADYNKEALVGVEYLFDDDSTFNNIFGDQISEGQYLVTENGIETTVDGQTMVNKVTYFDGNTMLWEAPVGKITFSIKLTKL